MCAVIMYFFIVIICMDTYICLYLWLKPILFYLVFLQIVFISDYLQNVRNDEFEMGKGYYCMWCGAVLMDQETDQ